MEWAVVSATCFEEFRQQNEKGARAFCLKLTRNVDEAEDIYQDSMIKAFQAFDRYDDRRASEAWLRQIIKCTFLDKLRRMNRRVSTVSFGQLSDDDHTFDPAADTLTPEEVLMESTASELFEKAYALLNEKDQAIIKLLSQGDLDRAEIAEAMHRKVSSLKSRIHRARRAFQAAIRHVMVTQGVQDPYMKETLI
ncbi:MAG: RNA polymerase sigma factor [Chthonomonas sp.]|nr:RNA polymerase sigma factor [Chthonomonas sp.]